MSHPLWDPSNLLQITSDIEDKHGEIQCVGQARSRNDARCRWTIHDPSLSAIRPLLLQMSCMKPASVAKQTLRRLAALCLCPDYHAQQVEQTATRWARVVQKASLYHENLLATVKPLQEEDVSSKAVMLDLQEKLAAAEAARHKYENDLNKEREQSRAQEEGLRIQIQQIEEQYIRQMREQGQDIRKELVAKQDTILRLQELNRKLTEEGEKNLANLAKYKKTNDHLLASQFEANQAHRELGSLQKDHAERLTEITTLTDQLSNFKNEIEKKTKSNTEIIAKLKFQEEESRRQLSDLSAERKRSSSLEKRIASLELSEAVLKSSISHCWLHGFWRFTARLKSMVQGLFRSSAMEKKPEDEIALTAAV